LTHAAGELPVGVISFISSDVSQRIGHRRQIAGRGIGVARQVDHVRARAILGQHLAVGVVGVSPSARLTIRGDGAREAISLRIVGQNRGAAAAGDRFKHARGQVKLRVPGNSRGARFWRANGFGHRGDQAAGIALIGGEIVAKIAG